MPVEIKELVIKAVVDESSKNGAAKPGNGAAPPQEDIIAACVDQVLRILKEKERR